MLEVIDNKDALVEHFESKGYASVTENDNKLIKLYTDVEKELEALYSGVGLRNISHLGLIELKGKDVLDFLHRITTNSIKDLPKEGVAKTVFTTEKGRIIGLGVLLNFEDYQLLVCDRKSKPNVMSWIRKYVITDDVQVNDANVKYSLLELCGPQADSFITLVTGNIVNEIEPNTFRIVNTENILFFLVKLVDEMGGNKFWMLGDYENSKKLVDYMLENKGAYDFTLIGEDAYNSYRIEQGIPVAPNELNDNYNPHEAGLIDFVDLNKGCFIGQEVIGRLDAYDKVQRQISGITFSEAVTDDERLTLVDENGNEAGIVTSSINSTKLKEYIGLAYIKKQFLNNETKLIAKNSKSRTIPVEVDSLPFIK
jgi:folate-binding protein YgfZ